MNQLLPQMQGVKYPAVRHKNIQQNLDVWSIDVYFAYFHTCIATVSSTPPPPSLRGTQSTAISHHSLNAITKTADTQQPFTGERTPLKSTTSTGRCGPAARDHVATRIYEFSKISPETHSRRMIVNLYMYHMYGKSKSNKSSH